MPKKTADNETKTVHSREEAQEIAINEDETSKNRQQGQKRKKNAKGNEESSEEEQLLPQERTTIDIRI
jgi:hypothetical protein